MLKLIVLCCAILFATVDGTSSPDNLLVIYGNDHSEIIVKNVTTGKMVKTFTIQVEKASGGIAIDYQKDLIFFADGKKLYRMHLVDEKGNRKISGKGELFTNKTAEHFEMLLCTSSGGNIQSFVFSEDDMMLYAFTDYYYKRRGGYYYISYILKVDPESGSVSYISYYTYTKETYSHSIYHNGIVYISAFDGIYNGTINKWAGSFLNKLASITSLSSFTIDKSTNRLYYIQRSTIRVLNGNFTTTPFSKDKTRIVLADSYVMKNANAIAIYGNIVIWSSLDWKKLYIGKLDKDMNFLSMRNIRILDGSSYDQKYEFNNIMIFEHTA